MSATGLRPTSVIATCCVFVATLAVAPPTQADEPPATPEVVMSELELDGVAPDEVQQLPDASAVPDAEAVTTPAPTTSATPAQPDPTSSAAVVEPTPETPAPSATPEDTAPVVAVPDVLTVELQTPDFSVLGITWDASDELEGVVIRYRVRLADGWSPWEAVGPSDAAGQGETDEATGSREGTDPIVAVGADGLQVWAEATSGSIRNLKALLIDPGEAPSDLLVEQAALSGSTDGSSGAVIRSAASVATAAVAQPTIIRRSGWGADESRRSCEPDYSTSVVSAVVHHTASSNGYSADAVPGMIRGFYAYHTAAEAAGGRGWCDIGYNFLVDQFGRIFEGRAGSMDTTVIGVHAGGFNSRSFGVAAIGNYSSLAPSGALVEGISRVIAWKFASLRITAGSSVTMVSGGGATKYPAGTPVTLPTIFAHRDSQYTACPGDQLYARMGAIRSRVASLSNASVSDSPRGMVDSWGGGGQLTVRGWAFDPTSSASLTMRVSVDGKTTTAVADKSRPDVGAAYGVGSRHGFSVTVGASRGQHVVCITAVDVGSGENTLFGCRWVTVTNRTPTGVLDGASTTPTSITVRGWALDPDTTAPIDVHAYVDGRKAATITANTSRPDIGRAYGLGSNHGFVSTFAAAQGTHRVCLYAINTPKGGNKTIGCKTVKVGNAPKGVFDGASTTPTSITVRGWALDPDTTAPIDVHAYVDGRKAATITANTSRPDIGRAYGLGSNHGFVSTFAAAQGTHRVCLYAINTPKGGNKTIGCKTVTVP